MAREFQYKSSKSVFTVKDENGEVIKKYVLNPGNQAEFKKITAKAKVLDDLIKNLDINDDELVNKVLEAEKDVIDTLLDGDFDMLFKKFDGDLFALLDLIYNLIDECSNNLSDKFTKYEIKR